MKRCSTYIKERVYYHNEIRFAPVWLKKIKSLTISKVNTNIEQQTGGRVIIPPLVENNLVVTSKTENKHTRWCSLSYLPWGESSSYLKGDVYKMFLAEIFIITKKWEQPKCWLKKQSMFSVYNRILYSNENKWIGTTNINNERLKQNINEKRKVNFTSINTCIKYKYSLPMKAFSSLKICNQYYYLHIYILLIQSYSY